MANVNTAAEVILQQNQGQPIVLSFGSGPGHKQFMIGAGAAIVTVPNPLLSSLSGVPFPPRSASAIAFVLRATGTITLGGNEKYQIDINQGTGLSPAIASSGSVFGAIGGGTDNWLIEATCLWDPTSTNLRGYFGGWVGPTVLGNTALTLSQPASLANLQFNVGVTITNANPVNSATLTELAIDFN